MTLILHSLINFLRLSFKINNPDGSLKMHGKLPLFKRAIMILNGFICFIDSDTNRINASIANSHMQILMRITV